MNKKQLEKFLNNPGPGMMDSALTQRRLEEAGVTISNDLLAHGFASHKKRKFPKYVEAFVDEQMRLIKLQNERNKNSHRRCSCDRV